MNKVGILFLFGLTLIVTGMFWMVFDQGLISGLITNYWVETPFLSLMYRGWNVIPIVILIVGIISTLYAGMSASRGVIVQ